MNKKSYLLFLIVIIIAFWQVVFLQNGMKWDFADSYLPSRYFFSESILNNIFPLWNPYMLYGIPIYADMVSVFSPEFWIVGNMFGYNYITLQFVYLAYIFIAGISFKYFLKQFNAEKKLAIALSIAYMLSGLSIGNAQHLNIVSGFALIPFILACYFKFLQKLNFQNLIQLSISLFLMIYASYPALTIILGYFMIALFIYSIITYRNNAGYIKRAFAYHIVLGIIVVLASSVLIISYIQIAPFLNRYGGLSIEIAQQHPFTFRSFISYLLPMATGKDAGSYFGTDLSMSNGYWGIISLVLFIFILTKKLKNNISYLILSFGILSLLVALGKHFFLREFLYNNIPFMNMFRYPSVFRAFTIFGFLAFIGINFRITDLTNIDKKKIQIIAGGVIVVIGIIVWRSTLLVDEFGFFKKGISFPVEIANSTRFDNIVLQGIIQIIILSIFIFITRRTKSLKRYSLGILILFVADGIVSTQLNIYYSVVGDTDPVGYTQYIKSSPKGFPKPELKPIKENSNRNAKNKFVWVNNNVYPKKVTFEGTVSFMLDGYRYLANNQPELLEAIKKEPIVYLSSDIRPNTSIKEFSSKTLFLDSLLFQKFAGTKLKSSESDKLWISNFSPQSIEIQTSTQYGQMLAYQQNYYTGWKVYVDGKKEKLINSNFAHMSVFVPSGKHSVVFEYKNPVIIYSFIFSYLLFIILIVLSINYYIKQHPDKKKKVIIFIASGVLIFILGSCLNRYFYQKNERGLSSAIIDKFSHWNNKYKNDVRTFLSTHNESLIKSVNADTVCFVDETTNLNELSQFLMNSKSRYFSFAWHNGIIDNELFELIYSFYPIVIEQEYNHNSGVILAERSDCILKNTIAYDFENYNTYGWNVDINRFRIDSLSGNYTFFFDNDDEWGLNVEIPVEGDLAGATDITILSDILFVKDIDEAIIICEIVRDGKKIFSENTRLDKFVKLPNHWCRAVYIPNFKMELKRNDLIKIFYWNIHKSSFHVDNIKLKWKHREQ